MTGLVLYQTGPLQKNGKQARSLLSELKFIHYIVITFISMLVLLQWAQAQLSEPINSSGVWIIEIVWINEMALSRNSPVV